MNVITLTGNATKDIELTYSPQGTAFAKGTIAVQRNFKNSKTGEYDTDFISFKSIGKISETIANYVRKGDKFGITGSLHIETYEKDGVKKYFTEVVVNGFDFPSKRDNGQGNLNTPNNNQNAHTPNTRISDDPFSGGPSIPISDDDLPFAPWTES